MRKSRGENNWRVGWSLEFWKKAECHWLKRWINSHASESLGIGSKTSGVEISGRGLYNLEDMDERHRTETQQMVFLFTLRRISIPSIF